MPTDGGEMEGRRARGRVKRRGEERESVMGTEKGEGERDREREEHGEGEMKKEW